MIHCIGNSHVNNFSNHEKLSYVSNDSRFSLHHIGPVIAYNFLEHHMVSVYNILTNVDINNDYVCIVVGEVDCRLHLPLQADQQNKSDEIMVNECVDRLFSCYDDLINKGYKVFCVGTHPTTTKEHDMSSMDSPIYGNVERRNNICVLWNDRLKYLSDKKNIPFVSIYDKLVDENNITKMEYFQDYCHLNSFKVFNFILDELKNKKII